MDRRALLKLIPFMTAAPSVALAAKPRSSIAGFQLSDTHARPFADKGDTVDYDQDDRELVSGRVYVTLTDTKKNLYICRARFAQGFWWAEIFEQDVWYGPMTRDFFQDRIRGRVTAVYKPIN
jgi:hypothetical protein